MRILNRLFELVKGVCQRKEMQLPEAIQQLFGDQAKWCKITRQNIEEKIQLIKAKDFYERLVKIKIK